MKALKQRLEKEKAIHKEDNNHVMDDNQQLLSDIQELRRVTTEKQTEFSKLGGTKQLKIVLEKIK